MKFLYRLLVAVACLAAATACVKDIIMDAMEDPELVVACVLSDDPVQVLKLLYTKGASRDQAPDPPEATAVLTDLTEGKEAGRFARSADGSWQLAYSAIPTHRYRLDVTVPGHEPVWAEQTMPEAPAIDVRWEWWRKHLPEDAKYRKNHGYIFSAGTLPVPVWFYGINYPDAGSQGELTERLFTDFPEVDSFNEIPASFWSGDASLLWNCWFSTSAYPDLEGAPYHRNYLRFPAREAERTDFLVSGDFRNYLSDPKDFVRSEKRFSELHYFSASEEYDRYLTDSFLFGQAGSSTDLADIFLRDNIYTNIQGAIGIFGAMVDRSVRWDDDQYWGEGPFCFAAYEKDARYPSPESYIDIPDLYPGDIEALTGQGHRPFSLLLYEVRAGHPEEWKYGLKLDPNISNIMLQPSGTTLYRIDNEDELLDHGMAEYGPVDFSTKTVLAAYNAQQLFGIPFVIDWKVEENQESGTCTGTFHIVFMNDFTSTNSNMQDCFTSCRVALVIDRADVERCGEINSFRSSVRLPDWPVREIILPQMGVEHH